MENKITEDDKCMLAMQFIEKREFLNHKVVALIIKKSEHPLYIPMSIMAKSIELKEKTNEVDPILEASCKKLKRTIHNQIRTSTEYIEYLNALMEFNEIKDLYVFSKKNK